MFHSIYYASKTLQGAQLNYTVIEKELLAVVFTFDKFHSYLVGTKVIVYTDHSAIKYLVEKKNVKPGSFDRRYYCKNLIWKPKIGKELKTKWLIISLDLNKTQKVRK